MGLDWLMLAWGAWALSCSPFHKTPGDYLIGQLGLVYNTLGVYFLIRSFCVSLEDVVHLVKITGLLLAPVAAEMILEQMTGRNLFSVFGGVPEVVTVRGERLRAQGPFAHGILAGTVGATCLPLMIGIWRKYPLSARIGLGSCLVMIFASVSSGPLMSLIFSVFALVLWRWRHLTKQMRIAAAIGYILLDIVMKAPAYFLIARIDLTGSSTGWHRAELISSAIRHLNEWWLAGTDYTRHWMPTGVSWSDQHCDITNHYIGYGMIGGLPLMLLFIACMWAGFRYVGRFLASTHEHGPDDAWFVWALGASLFSHAASCVSVYYFDQSVLFLYLDFALLGCVAAILKRPRTNEDSVALDASDESSQPVIA